MHNGTHIPSIRPIPQNGPAPESTGSAASGDAGSRDTIRSIGTTAEPAALSETPLRFRSPWMVAVWPGMGHVATTAGYYLMAHLQMNLFAEFLPKGLFDLGEIQVRNGLILPPRLPLSRFFAWRDPSEQHDLIVFIGEAQPPVGTTVFCDRLIDYARAIGVERIFTFAAMATDMHPHRESRVFAAATDAEYLEQLCQKGQVEVIEDGRIAGMNGTLLASAAESGLPGCCLLGEMPHLFAGLPYPKASLEVLRTFESFAHLPLDLAELEEQSRRVDERLGQLLSEVEARMSERRPPSELEEGESPSFLPTTPEERLSALDRTRIEELFREAAADRSRAYELKAELDRLEVFQEYEDRFLDLFKSAE